jgi:hypothetical protein
MVTKVNPVFDATLPRSFAGKTISQFDIDLGADASGSLAPFGAVDRVLQTITERATMLMHSDVTGTGELLTVFLEGEFPTDTYDGTNSETFAAYLASAIVALGTVDSVDLSGAAVTAGTVFQADQTNT